MPDARFDLTDPAFLDDPYPIYRRLREADPVHHHTLGFWVLTRHDHVFAALRDGRFGKGAVGSAAVGEPGSAAVEFSMVTSDPPDHTRLRALVSQAFTPGVVDALRPHIQHIADELLGRLDVREVTDLIERFAYPLPLIVICEMLGVPVEDHERISAWSRDFTHVFDQRMLPPDSDPKRSGAAAYQALISYFRALIAERRAFPGRDLLSALIAAKEEGDRLSEDELLGTCIVLLVAGHETTANLIGNGTLALLSNSVELRRLRGSPELIASAVEELLRYDAPVQRVLRIPSTDVKIDGRTITAGETVMLFLGAANRDPEQFPEPDRLDITRADGRGMGFGGGIHFCLGASLGRLEAQIAIGTLVQRFPNIALATAKPHYRRNLTFRGLNALPVLLRG